MDPIIDSDWLGYKNEPIEEASVVGNVARSWQWRERGLDPAYCPSNKTVLENIAEDILVQKPLNIRCCDLPGYPRSTFLMVFSPDGTKVASTHGNHNVYVSELASGKHVRILKGHPRTPWCIAFHPSHPQLIGSGCLGGQVRVWDISTGGSEVWNVRNETVIASIAFHPREQLLVIATYNELYFWDWSRSSPFTKVSTNNFNEKVRYVAFDSLGYKLITGISLWANAHGSSSGSILTHNPMNPMNNQSTNRRDDSNDNTNSNRPQDNSTQDMIVNSYHNLVQRYDSLVRNYQRLFMVRHRLTNTPPPPSTIDRGTDPMETDVSSGSNWTRSPQTSTPIPPLDDDATPAPGPSQRQDSADSGDGESSSSRLLNLDVLSFDSNSSRQPDSSQESPQQQQSIFGSRSSAFQPLNDPSGRSPRNQNRNGRTRLLPNPFSSTSSTARLCRSPTFNINNSSNNQSSREASNTSRTNIFTSSRTDSTACRDFIQRRYSGSYFPLMQQISNRTQNENPSTSTDNGLRHLLDIGLRSSAESGTDPSTAATNTSPRPTMTNTATQMSPVSSPVDAQTINESLDLIRDILRDSGTRLLNLITNMSLSTLATVVRDMPQQRTGSRTQSDDSETGGQRPNIRPRVRLFSSSLRRDFLSSSSDSDSDQSLEVNILRTRNSTFRSNERRDFSRSTNTSSNRPTDRMVIELGDDLRNDGTSLESGGINVSLSSSRFRVRTQSNSLNESSLRENERDAENRSQMSSDLNSERLPSRDNFNTDRISTTTDNFNLDRPSTSKDNFNPDRSSTSRDNFNLDRPTTSRDNVNSGRSSSCRDNLYCDIPSTSRDHYNPDRPPTSRDHFNPERPSTSRDDLNPDRPSTSRGNLNPDRPSTSKYNFNPDRPSTSRDNFNPDRPSTSRDNFNPDRPSTSRDNFNPDRPSTSRDNFNPDRPSTSRDNFNPDRPSTSKDNFNPDRPSTSRDNFNPDRPSTSKDNFNPDRPSTSKNNFNPDRPSTSRDNFNPDRPSTSRDNFNPDRPSTSRDNLNSERPSTSKDNDNPETPSTSSDNFWTANSAIPSEEAYRKVKAGVNALQKHTVLLTQMWLRGNRTTMRELRNMWENLRRRIIMLHRETGRQDVPSYYTRSLLERCMMLTDMTDNSRTSGLPRASRSAQRNEDNNRNNEGGRDIPTNAENANNTTSPVNEPSSTSETTSDSRVQRSSRSPHTKSSSNVRTSPVVRRRLQSCYRWRTDDELRRSRTHTSNRLLSTYYNRSRRDFARALEINTTRHAIRMRAMQVLSVMFNMMMMCLEERGLSQLIIHMLRTLKKALALTCLMLMTNRNNSRSGTNTTPPSPRVDSLNVVRIQNIDHAGPVNVDEPEEPGSPVNANFNEDDASKSNKTSNDTETPDTENPRDPQTSSNTTEETSVSTSRTIITHKWSNRLAVQIAAANRNTSSTARTRRELYLESKRLKALHRTNPTAHPLIRKRIIIPPITNHRIPALRNHPTRIHITQATHRNRSEPIAGPSSACPIAESTNRDSARSEVWNEFEQRVNLIRIAHMQAVRLRNAARNRFRRLQTIRLYTPSSVREMFALQSNTTDNPQENRSSIQNPPAGGHRRSFTAYRPHLLTPGSEASSRSHEDHNQFHTVLNNVAMPLMQVNDLPVMNEGSLNSTQRVPRIHEYLQPIILAQNAMVVDDDGNPDNGRENGGGGGIAASGLLPPAAFAPRRLSGDVGFISEALPAPSHRVQAWDFTSGNAPDIADSTKNVVVQRCRIHNDASIDISKDGRLLVALLPVPRLRNTNHWLGVYSLEWARLGQCLHTAVLEQSAVSVALSPTARYLAVGLGSRRFTTLPHARNNVFALLYKLDPLESSSRTGLAPVKELEQNWEQGFTSLNCLRWAPQPGQGLVYANNTGQLIIMS